MAATPLSPPVPSSGPAQTPNPTRSLPADITQPTQTHNVGLGESLGYIAQLYGSSVEELLALNELSTSDYLYVGQVLIVPAKPIPVGPSLKLIPDSELVYGPAAAGFDVRAVAEGYGGYLSQHSEEVEGQMLQGPEIVQLVADRYSVNPRLLLTILEFRAGWVSGGFGGDTRYPLGYVRAGYEGLYMQLGWAANELNWGYYGRAEAGVANFVLGGDGTRVAFAPDINDGTAGVQNLLAAHSAATYTGWLEEVAPSGFFATYGRLFGNPFAYTVDPLWPADLIQPSFRLAWGAGDNWYFTGGPHGGWAGGSAWAALDFVPNSEQLGCYPSDAWVLAVAEGVISRSSFGAVVLDLDQDGFAGTGWAVTHQHLESRDRVAPGTIVRAGDRLGHPSCEGGYSNGTHVHIARTYNGRWVSADGAIPFAMGGWVSQGTGREYDGQLLRDGKSQTACECREEWNVIPGQ
jgi:LysM repeat protein